MKGLKNFEHIWQEKFLHASVNPSERVWELIALQIDEKRQQRRRKIIAWWAAAMLALFLGDGELLYQRKGLIGEWFGETNISNFTIIHDTPTNTNKLISPTPKTTPKNPEKAITQYANDTKILQEKLLTFQVKAEFEVEKEAVLAQKHQQEFSNEKVGTPKAKRWWVQQGLNVGKFQQNWHYTPSPILAGRMLNTPQEQVMLKREENLLKELSTYQTLCTWGAGMDLGFQINKNWFVSGGFQWRKSYAVFQSNAPVPILAKFYGNVPNLDVEAPPVSTINSTPSIEIAEGGQNQVAAALPNHLEVSEVTYRHTTEFISIPLKIGYQLQKNKWRGAVAVGTEANFLINNTFSSETATYSSVFEKINRVQYAGISELQIGYQIAPKLYLQVTPSFRQMLTPLFKNYSSLQLQNQKLWFVGVGMQWRL